MSPKKTTFTPDSTLDATKEPLPKSVLKQYTSRPILRIGFMEGYEKIDFRVSDKFDITDLEGNPIFTGIKSPLKWRSLLDSAKGATFIYSVLVTASREEAEANALASKLKKIHSQVKVRRLGGKLMIDKKVINDNTKHRITAGAFETETEAKKLMGKFKEDYAPRIIREKVKEPQGKIEIYDAEYDYSSVVDKGFRIIPKSEETTITLYGVRVGTGLNWESMADRTYKGIIEIRVGGDAHLCAISEISLDRYLKGVVPAEMPTEYPQEALKAQAVAARCEVLAKIGTKHINDPFDFCASVHCQVYSGTTNEAQSTDEAVTSTQGEVMYYGERVCDAVYSAVCGGHTEHKHNVWNPPEEPYLQGKYDAPSQNNDKLGFDLTNEKDVRTWITSRPDVFCSLNQEDLPPIVAYSKKYSRWEVSYSRKDLEEIIVKRTGEDIGTLYDIVPLQRGVSGRLIEVEILGSRKNIRIKKELNIRRALSPTYLRSACFVIDVEVDQIGTPMGFIFRGAGWGHGVGMCQTGAAVMALNGYNYRQILNHYYSGIDVKSVYKALTP